MAKQTLGPLDDPAENVMLEGGVVLAGDVRVRSLYVIGGRLDLAGHTLELEEGGVEGPVTGDGSPDDALHGDHGTIRCTRSLELVGFRKDGLKLGLCDSLISLLYLRPLKAAEGVHQDGAQVNEGNTDSRVSIVTIDFLAPAEGMNSGLFFNGSASDVQVWGGTIINPAGAHGVFCGERMTRSGVRNCRIKANLHPIRDNSADGWSMDGSNVIL